MAIMVTGLRSIFRRMAVASILFVIGSSRAECWTELFTSMAVPPPARKFPVGSVDFIISNSEFVCVL